jgi:hypothetical protein
MKQFRGLVVAAVSAVIALGFSASPALADGPVFTVGVCLQNPALCVVVDGPVHGDDNDPWH